MKFAIWPDWMDRRITLDEPELGLHPSAQQVMFNGLTAWEHGSTVLTASHSATAFRNSAVQLIRVDRDQDGFVTCSPMSSELQNCSEVRTRNESDWIRADLLQAVRRFVLWKASTTSQ